MSHGEIYDMNKSSLRNKERKSSAYMEKSSLNLSEYQNKNRIDLNVQEILLSNSSTSFNQIVENEIFDMIDK